MDGTNKRACDQCRSSPRIPRSCKTREGLRENSPSLPSGIDIQFASEVSSCRNPRNGIRVTSKIATVAIRGVNARRTSARCKVLASESCGLLADEKIGVAEPAAFAFSFAVKQEALGPKFGQALNRFAYSTPRQIRVSFGVRF